MYTCKGLTSSLKLSDEKHPLPLPLFGTGVQALAPKPGSPRVYQPRLGAGSLHSQTPTQRLPVDSQSRRKNDHRLSERRTISVPEAGRGKRAQTLENRSANGKNLPSNPVRSPARYAPTQAPQQESFGLNLSAIRVSPGYW